MLISEEHNQTVDFTVHAECNWHDSALALSVWILTRALTPSVATGRGISILPRPSAWHGCQTSFCCHSSKLWCDQLKARSSGWFVSLWQQALLLIFFFLPNSFTPTGSSGLVRTVSTDPRMKLLRWSYPMWTHASSLLSCETRPHNPTQKYVFRPHVEEVQTHVRGSVTQGGVWPY